MLSTKVVGNVGQASHYFLGHDNYYTENDTLEKNRSEWWGKGAQDLNLSGEVSKELFSDLLHGKLPNGEKLGVKIDGQLKHRPGFDLTLSVPKSVSILALIGGDKKILDAVNKAANKTLESIEHACAQARITQKGETTYENTKNLVVAKFLHDISREADPQLHVHCVVMNMTKRSDGNWRSLASQAGRYGSDVPREVNGFIERVRTHKLHFGAVFRGELAYEMRNLGYDIVRTGKNGFFEIAGVSKEVIDLYSQRSQQIKAYMKDHGLESQKAADMTTLSTRKAKKDFSRESLDFLWKERAKELETAGKSGIDVFKESKQIFENAISNRQKMNELGGREVIKIHHTQEVKEASLSAVRSAIEKISETQVSMQEIQILNFALKFVLDNNVTLESIIEAVDTFKSNGDLIALNKDEKGKSSDTSVGYFTTQKLIEYEKIILRASSEKVKNNARIVPEYKIDAYLYRENTLFKEQKEAIKQVFLNDNRIAILEGSANTEKTLLLKPMMDLARLEGYQALLLTGTRKEGLDIQGRIERFPESLREWMQDLFNKKRYETVTGFLKSDQQETLFSIFNRKKIIFVENANLISSRQQSDLIQTAQRQDARLVLLGDKSSLLSFKAGSPFIQMITQGAFCVTLPTVENSNSKDIKLAIDDSLSGNIAGAFQKIGHKVFSVENKGIRLELMATHYAAMDQKERENTIVLMPTRAQVDEMNHEIREVLKNQNVLDKNGHKTSVLLPHFFNEKEALCAVNYEVNQFVKFNKGSLSLMIRNNEYLKVIGIQPGKNLLVLENSSQRKIFWNPERMAKQSGNVETFDCKTRELSAGDLIVFRKGNRQKEITAGDHFKIESIQNNRMSLSQKNGKRINLDLRENSAKHFDHSYATTPWQYLPKQANVIAYQNSYSRQSHQRQFYKTLTQAEQNVWIYTENKEALLNSLNLHTGNKVTTVDLLLEEVRGTASNADSQKNFNDPTGYLSLIEKTVSKALETTKALNKSEKSPTSIASEAVKYALQSLSEREAAFEHKDVLRVALMKAFSQVNKKLIEDQILQAEKNGELIRGIFSKDGTKWTTQDAIAIEREILAFGKQDKGKISQITSPDTIEAYVKGVNPKEEHSEVLRAVSTTQDRLLMVDGYAGTGKTTLLKYLKPFIEKLEVKVLCLAPTHTAVKELKAQGAESQTLDSFLAQNRNNQTSNTLNKHQNKLLIVVDESSMVSNRRKRDFLKVIHSIEARSIIIGDILQYSAIEAGKPAYLLQKDPDGVKTLHLKEIERQKESPELLKAVKETYKGDFKEAFNTLGDRIIEIKGAKGEDGRVARFRSVCDAYLSKSKEERAQTMIITLGNKDRILQNEMIRQGLKEKGELSGEVCNSVILISKDMTEVEKKHALNYQVEDKVRFGLSNSALKIEKGEYLSVREIKPEQNLLVLEKENKELVFWRPSDGKSEFAGVEVYKADGRELMQGDLIRWTRSDKNLGLLSPNLAIVESVSGKEVKLRFVDATREGLQPVGEAFSVIPNERRYQHWDHAYAMTGYSSQAKTIRNVILSMESYRINLVNQPSFLVMLTRASHTLSIYTDDKEALLENIMKNTGQKTSALETIGEFGKPKIKAWSETTKITKVEGTEKITENSKTENRLPNVHSRSFGSDREKTVNPSLDAKLITKLLHENTESVLEKIMGEPKEKDSKHYRYGSKHGSLIVTVQGEKRGLWHDFQTGEGGNLLHLIAKQSGMNHKSDFKKLLQEASRLLGSPQAFLSRNSGKKEGYKSEISSKSTGAIVLTDTQKKSLKYAQKLAQESIPVKGTLAESYLRDHRGINLDEWPDSIRFHPAIYSKTNDAINPALLVVAKDEKGKTKAVQAVFLNEETGQKADVKVKKQTWGLPSSGASAELSFKSDSRSKQSMPVYLAEGPETALSIFAAMPKAHVKITLGKSNFKNINLEKCQKDVVLCLDNDSKLENHEKTNGAHKNDRAIQDAAEKFLSNGSTVWLAKPELAGQDYNDVLKAQGLNAIKESIENARTYKDFTKNTQDSGTLKSNMLNQLDRKLHLDNQNENLKFTKMRNDSLTKTTDVRALKERSDFVLNSGIQQKNNENNMNVSDLTKIRHTETKLDRANTPHKSPEKTKDFENEI